MISSIEAVVPSPMSLLYLLFFLLGAVTAVQSQSPIEEVLAKQAAAWNRGDIAGYMEGYWKSDSLLFTSGGKVRRGWQQTFEKYTQSYGSKAKMGALSFSHLEVHLLSPASAWVFGRWDLTREHDHPGGVFTLVLRKFPAGWRIVHDH